MATNGIPPARNVVVTGASTGIGEACAMRLDQMGFNVFAGVRRPADGDLLRRKASSRLTPIILDVTDQRSIDDAEMTVANAVGKTGLSGLVNNAGISVAGPIEFLPINDLRRQLEVNVIGQVAVTQAFMPLLRVRRGRIVNIGSIGGRLSTPFLGPYSASKFAMEAITDALRLELRPWKMHVAIVEPGSIATPIWDKAQSDARRLLDTMPERAHELYDQSVDVMLAFADVTAKRGIPPDEVAKSVAHALTSKKPKTRYLVGTDARIQAVVAKAVPDRLRDGLLTRQLGLPNKPPATKSGADSRTLTH